MRQECIERLIVESGHHLCHGLLRVRSGDDGGPCFLLCGLKFRREMLPLQLQLLVAPRHIDVSRSEIPAILSHHRDTKREAPAHGLGDRLFYLLLGKAVFCPETLQHLSAMLDFDECTGLGVSGAPKRHELGTRLQRPFWRSNNVRHAHSERFIVELQHVELQTRSDRFSESVIGCEHRAIGPGFEREKQRRLPRAVRLEGALHCDFAEFPRIWIRRIRLRVLCCERSTSAPLHWVASTEGLPHDLRGLFEAMDLYHALGSLRLVVVGLCGDRNLDGLVRSLPFVRSERGLQRRVADVYAALRCARFSSCVGYVRVDGEAENRLVFFRYRAVRLRGKLDYETAVVFCHRGSMRDFLRSLRRHRAPPEVCAPPIGEPHLPHDAVTDLCAPDRRTCVRGCLAIHGYFLAQFARLFWSLNRDLKLGPFVFLNVELSLAARFVRRANRHAPREPVPRCREAAAERTVVVCLVLGLRDFLSVHVGKQHRHCFAGQHFVIVVVTVCADANAFILNGLAGAVERAIGKEERLRKDVGPLVFPPALKLVARRELLVFERHEREGSSIGARSRCEHSIGVRLHRRTQGVFCIARDPELHLRTFDRIAGARIDDEAFGFRVALICAHHDGEVAHPKIRERDHIIVCAKSLVVARDEEIKARLQVLRRCDFFGALTEVGRRWQLRRPRVIGHCCEQCSALVIIEPLKLRASFQLRRPVHAHDAEMDFREVAITDRNGRERFIPNTLDVHLRRLCFDLLNDIVAEFSADAVRECARALLCDLVRLCRFVRSKELCPIRPGPCREFVVAPLLGEALQCSLIARVFFLAGRAVLPESQTFEIAVKQRRLIRVRSVKAQQCVEKPYRLGGVSGYLRRRVSHRPL